MIDIDTKGMPQAVKGRVEELGGLLGAIKHVLPELATVGHVIRRSTSSCIRRADTGEALAGSGGVHVYVLVRDGTDIQRFLYTLHARCWLNGLGWMTIGAAGQLLNRSLVDRMVYSPERLVFEGTPELETPLVQDLEQRRAEVFEGPPLDTIVARPPLRLAEKAKLEELEVAEAHRLAPERSKAREKFVKKQACRLSARSGITLHAARHIVELQIDGILQSEVELPFDDDEFRGCTVDDVLNDPDRFEGATLADPVEGIEYGRCKAKILRRKDGTLFIHSFAHGRTVYELRFSATKVEALLNVTPDAELVDVFVKLALRAELASHDRERLRNLVHDRTGTNKRTIDQRIKKDEEEAAARRKQNERERLIAERRDPRPPIPVPLADAPFLPEMEVLNDILGSSDAAEPPARDIDGYITQVRIRRPTHMHELTPEGSNADGADQAKLPAPEYPLLTRLDQAEVAELIEQYIDYINKKFRSVHLPSNFVQHFVRRNDTALPLVTGIATLPILLVNGTMLSGKGLHRDRGIIFRVPDQLAALIPSASECTDAAVAAAIDYLINEWLCDVATDYKGKCILIAMRQTIIERTELPERPAFS